MTFTPPKNDSFCVYPWFHQNIDSRGEVTLCCRSNISLGDAKDIDEVWNGDEIKSIREKMLRGERTPHCNTCYHHEKIGRKSNRQLATEVWYPEYMWGPNIEESLRNGFEVTQTPSRIDLKFGNLCNLTCRMCSGKYSSQINKDIAALRKMDPAGAEEFGASPVGGDFNWYENPRFWEIMDRYIPELLQLDITGGEPTLVDQNMVMLNRCIELGYADSIKLSLNTNLTNLKPAFLEAITKFKKVTVNCSLDGMGDVQEYIRHPSKWSVVEKNLITLFKMSRNTSIFVNISTVAQLYNVFQMPEFIEHILELYATYGNPSKQMKHQIAPVMWPTYYSLSNLPQPVKDAVIVMSEEWLETHTGRVYEDGLYRNLFETFINQCRMEGSHPAKASMLLRRAKFEDQNKKVALADNIPEIHALLVEAEKVE